MRVSLDKLEVFIAVAVHSLPLILVVAISKALIAGAL